MSTLEMVYVEELVDNHYSARYSALLAITEVKLNTWQLFAQLSVKYSVYFVKIALQAFGDYSELSKKMLASI